MPLLFSYGTLRQEGVQLATFGRALDGSEDQLVGYALSLVAIEDDAVLAASGKAQHPIARPSHDPTARVMGIAFELTEAELARADAYEVSAYTRIATTLKSGRQAWVYVDAKGTTAG